LASGYGLTLNPSASVTRPLRNMRPPHRLLLCMSYPIQYWRWQYLVKAKLYCLILVKVHLRLLASPPLGPSPPPRHGSRTALGQGPWAARSSQHLKRGQHRGKSTC